MQIIATLTLTRPQIGKPDWASHTRNVVVVAIHHRDHAGQFEAFMFDDHAKWIGYRESKLADFSHFIAALVRSLMGHGRLTSESGSGIRPNEGVVPIPPGTPKVPGDIPPRPISEPSTRVSLLARSSIRRISPPSAMRRISPLRSHRARRTQSSQSSSRSDAV